MKFLKDTVNFFRHDWKHNRTLFWVEATSTLAAMLASMTLAVTAPTPPWVFVYSFYFIASSMGMVNSYMRNSGWWFMLNFYFTVANVIGFLSVTGVFDIIVNFLGISL